MAAIRSVWPADIPIADFENDICGDNLDTPTAYSADPLGADQMASVLDVLAGPAWHDEGSLGDNGVRHWSRNADGRRFDAFVTETDSSTQLEIAMS